MGTILLATALCCLAQIKPCVATLTPQELRDRRMARFGAALGGSSSGRRAAPVPKASKENAVASPAAISQDTKPEQSINPPAPPAKKPREPSSPLAPSAPVTQPAEEKSITTPVTDDCPICICPPEDGETLACGHVICKDCLIGMFEASARPDDNGIFVANGAQCPKCRGDTFTDDCRPSHPDVLQAYIKYCGNGGNKNTVAQITEAGVEMSDNLVDGNKSLLNAYKSLGPNAVEIRKQIDKALGLLSQRVPADRVFETTGILIELTPDGPKIGCASWLRAPKWPCRHCTYRNSEKDGKCAMCTLPRDP